MLNNEIFKLSIEEKLEILKKTADLMNNSGYRVKFVPPFFCEYFKKWRMELGDDYIGDTIEETVDTAIKEVYTDLMENEGEDMTIYLKK